IEGRHHRREIVGVGVQIVPGPGLAAPAMPPPVMRDAAVPLTGQEEHLVVPCVGAERPAVAEHDWLTGAPILVVDLGAIERGDHRHTGLRVRRPDRKSGDSHRISPNNVTPAALPDCDSTGTQANLSGGTPWYSAFPSPRSPCFTS